MCLEKYFLKPCVYKKEIFFREKEGRGHAYLLERLGFLDFPLLEEKKIFIGTPSHSHDKREK